MRRLTIATALVLGCTSSSTPAPNDSGTMTMNPGEDSGMMEPEDTGPPPCVYPAGPYGYVQGSTVSPGITWQGYAPGSDQVTTLSTKDLYDCDGRFGINAILFDEGALWCGPCQQEATALPGFLADSWEKNGVEVVSLIVQDLQQKPATTAHALTWRNTYKLGSLMWVAADPAWIFSHEGTNGLPMNVLVDPRRMKIVKIVEGYGGKDPSVDALATKNKM